jgi:AcrR family transcriptional regulator
MGVTSRKEREKELRKEAILDAAMRVFKRKGYQATSMGEIAKEAEFSKGTLYLYFNSKYALFAELSNRVVSQVLEGFVRISGEELEGREMIAQMLGYWAEVASANIRQFRLAMSWVASDERPDAEDPGALCHRERVGMIIGHIAAAIVRGKGDGSIQRDGDPATQACQLWSGMMGALLFSSRMDDLADDFPVSVQTEGFMGDFVALLTAGLGAKS